MAAGLDPGGELGALASSKIIRQNEQNLTFDGVAGPGESKMSSAHSDRAAAMNHQAELSPTFWTELERTVSSKVGDALNTDEIPHELLISYLRDLEVLARTACDRRQTVQIIASGRSVLGDRTAVGPQDCAFS